MTFTTIKTRIRENLNDAGITFHTATDLDDSVQDAYDDIAIISGCIIKKQAAISFIAKQVYYQLVDDVSDLFMPLAIYNNGNNRWLFDNINRRQLDLQQHRWEVWYSSPIFWIPINWDTVAIVPIYSAVSSETFDLYYAATAPTVVDGSEPLIVEDMHDLIEDYCTGDLLEQAEEFAKAERYWARYYLRVLEYKKRVKSLAKADIRRIA
jgi:hypothetical protein